MKQAITGWPPGVRRGWYGLTQDVLAPGAQAALASRLRPMVARLPPRARILDVGCGPASWLWLAGGRPVGVDAATDRAAAFRRGGGPAAVASAIALPFNDGRFDAVFSFGLLHHLPDDGVRRALAEMVRVARAGGATIVFDSVRPEPGWRRPLAWAVRQLDRGRWMRRQQDLEALMPERQSWTCERFSYALTGLEGIWCVRAKDRCAAAPVAGSSLPPRPGPV